MNKSNAHLYLPLVQALADGKTLQHKVSNEWRDLLYADFTSDPEDYRIKPLEWPPIPDGCSLHNPDNLTPDQVGDGYRLITDREFERNKGLLEARKEIEAWLGGKWDDTEWTGSRNNITYRVPIQTPYPDGSRIVDGKLVKPWVPKFKVGDRVTIIDGGAVHNVSLINHSEGTYKLSNGLKYYGDTLRLAPWSPSRHIPGFRPLRDGESWHREDWREEMLPEGWRPLLMGEIRTYGDEGFYNQSWVRTSDLGSSSHSLNVHLRTRRPLPEPKKRVPLGPSDVPPGSVFRFNPNHYCTPLNVNPFMITFWLDGMAEFSWRQLQSYGAEILRPGQTEWQPCYREE